MTDEQVRTTIDVLKAYVAGTLALDNDLLEQLENAIEAAFYEVADMHDYLDYHDYDIDNS